MIQKISRLVRHLATGDLALGRHFSKSVLEELTAAIKQSESQHQAEIGFCIEASLPSRAILADVTSRQRALEVFAIQRFWDTERNTGVLLYLLLADKRFEIVVDRGIAALVTPSQLEMICHEVQRRFAANDLLGGILAGLNKITELLAQRLPSAGPRANEIPDETTLI